MHGLLVTFRTSIPVDRLRQPFTDYAHALRDVPGLISKVWLHDGDALGGFHVFTGRESAEAYLASHLAIGLRATDGFDDFEVRHFEVLDDLSALTGVVEAAPLAAH